MSSRYPSSGKFRRRIAIQSVVRAPDANGDRVDVWTTIANGVLWADVNVKSGREASKNSAIVDAENVQIDIRYNPAVTPMMRAAYTDSTGTRLFYINSSNDENEQHVTMNLLCTEVSSG